MVRHEAGTGPCERMGQAGRTDGMGQIGKNKSEDG